MNDEISTFQPSYVWPNRAFPFREYYIGEKCRIFIIENIQHNWPWLSSYSNYFKESDYFFVYCGWFHSMSFAREADKIFNMLGLSKSNFIFLFNSYLEKENFNNLGFGGDVINHNAWLDENLVMRPLNYEKIYRAIYVARRSQFKRHMLAAKVSELALVSGNNHGNSISETPSAVYINPSPLSAEEVCVKINQSSCGLILSAIEGACFSSSEYLLCGIPVVSTASKGGRDVWYNEYNSIICDDTVDGVAEAVELIINRNCDPNLIRQMHIDLSFSYRAKFIEWLALIFDRHGVDMCAEIYFRENFFHKMRRSYAPKFDKIFMV